MEQMLRVDLKGFSGPMRGIARQQLPFAIAQALTMTAGHAGLSWQDEMQNELDRPAPFTLGSVGVRPARKTTLIATVYIRDIAAAYLEPFVDGGTHYLGGKKGLLSPKNVGLNAYGNLTRNKLATLKGKSNVFVGGVKLRSGDMVNGVWQRASAAQQKRHAKAKGRGPAALKLLIRFSDPQRVTQHLDFIGRADAAVRQHFTSAFEDAFDHAMRTAR